MNTQPLRVVMIDDHELVRRGLRQILMDEPDFELVGEASDGVDGVAVVEATQPDVVLLDARLPTSSGAEVCRLVVERAPQARVLMLSAFGDDELVYQCLMAGATGYILKDVLAFDLTKSLRAVARGEAVIDSRVASAVVARLRSPDGTPSHGLSPHQLSVLRLMSHGYSNREIAEQLYLSENTIKGYVQEILRRLQARNRLDAVMIANRKRLL